MVSRVVLLLATAFSAACSRDRGTYVTPRPADLPPPQVAPSSAPAQASPPAADTSPPATPQQLGRLAQLALGALPAVRAQMSLGAWKHAFPRDTVELYRPTLAEHDQWCARATREVALDAYHSINSAAYFFPPARPEPAVLPSAADAPGLIDHCTLGYVLTEVAYVDSNRAPVLDDETNRIMSAALGPAASPKLLGWWGSASWHRNALWRSGVVNVVSAITDASAWEPRYEAFKPARVIVIAAIRRADVDVLWDFTPGFERSPEDMAREKLESERTAARAGEVIALASIEGGAERELRTQFARLSDKSSRGWTLTTAEQAPFAHALGSWIARALPLPPPRRAAALLAADRLLDELGGRAGILGPEPEQEAFRKQLEAIGVHFAWSQLGDGFWYTRHWLKEAWATDSTGRAGEIAFIALMELGFDTSLGCTEQHGLGFRAVIAEGQRFLARNPSSRSATDIHFMMAAAYGDIVRMAAGGGYQEPDSTGYGAESAAARVHAIEQYRIAFARDSTSLRARAGWTEAWRLMAGIAPTRTYFYCVYD